MKYVGYSISNIVANFRGEMEDSCFDLANDFFRGYIGGCDCKIMPKDITLRGSDMLTTLLSSGAMEEKHSLISSISLIPSIPRFSSQWK